MTQKLHLSAFINMLFAAPCSLTEMYQRFSIIITGQKFPKYSSSAQGPHESFVFVDAGVSVEKQKTWTQNQVLHALD